MRALRPVFLALALIVALDLVLALPAARRAPHDVRIPRVSTQGLAEQADAMAADDAVSVAVVGDSVIQGLFAERNETMPFYLDRNYEEAGRPVRAYNLGMSAAHGLEIFAASDTVARRGHADVVVLTFNYGFYGNPTTSPRYSWLYADPSWVGTAGADPAVKRAIASAEASHTVSDSADELLGRVWRLYGSRGYYSAVLFDGQPPEVVSREVTEWREKATGKYRSWRKLEPRELDGERLRTMFDVPELSLAHDDARLFMEAIDRAQDLGAHVIVVTTPLNMTGLRYHDALDEARFKRNIAWVRSEATSRGADFLDLASDFPEELIADSVHPTPAGYAEMARRVQVRIEPFVSVAEERRGEDR